MDTLNEAWAAAEAAVPEGWGFALARTNGYRADAWDPDGRPKSNEAITIRARGDTPAAALRGLVACLNEPDGMREGQPWALDWADYEAKDDIERVGLALIASGCYLDDPAGGPGAVMDRRLAEDVLEDLAAQGYRLVPVDGEQEAEIERIAALHHEHLAHWQGHLPETTEHHAQHVEDATRLYDAGLRAVA